MLPLSAALAAPSNLERLEDVREGIERASRALVVIHDLPIDPKVESIHAKDALERIFLVPELERIEEALRNQQSPPVAEYVDKPHQ